MAKNRMMGWLILAFALVAVVLGSAKYSQAAVPCEEATATVAPCKSFLVNDDRKPSSACCTAIHALQVQATSKPDLQDLCQCLKKQGSQLAFKPDRAKRLAQFCGASIPIDPAIDCSMIA